MTPTPPPRRMTAWLEQAWLTRYLDRQLADEETTWFETYMLDKPELLTTIEADADLRDALTVDAARREARSADGDATDATGSTDVASGPAGPTSIEAIAANDTQPTAVGTFDSHRQSRPRQDKKAPTWLSLAAALLVGLGAGWIVNGMRAPQSAASAIVASPTRIIYDTMRGEAAAPRVEHADSKSSLVLIEVAVPPGAENITLKLGAAPEQILTASPDGFVSFLAPRETIAKSRDARIEYSLLGKETRLPIAFQ